VELILDPKINLFFGVGGFDDVAKSGFDVGLEEIRSRISSSSSLRTFRDPDSQSRELARHSSVFLISS
jgi:hypothetical protein